MNIELNYNGKVSDSGVLSIINRKGLEREISVFKGKEVELIIRQKKQQRSNGQNRYFHGVAIPIIKYRLIELGYEEAYSTEWVKDFVKCACLKVDVINKETGEVMESLGKTSALSKSEFADMVQRLERFCAEKLDIQLPMPNEELTLNFE